MAPALNSSSSFRHYDDNIDLDILQQRARKWIEHILDEPLPADKPLSDLLADGVILEQVGQRVREKYRERYGEAEAPAPGLRKMLSKQQTSTWGTKVHWDAMANVASFLKVCTEVGLTDVHLCTPQDVVDQKNVRNVYLCIRTLAIRLFHVKVVPEEFEPAEKGATPAIYYTQREEAGHGHVGSVVRRIDEGIFNYPSIRAHISEDGDVEYDDEEEDEESEEGEQETGVPAASPEEDGPGQPLVYARDLEDGAQAAAAAVEQEEVAEEFRASGEGEAASASAEAGGDIADLLAAECSSSSGEGVKVLPVESSGSCAGGSPSLPPRRRRSGEAGEEGARGGKSGSPGERVRKPGSKGKTSSHRSRRGGAAAVAPAEAPPGSVFEASCQGSEGSASAKLRRRRTGERGSESRALTARSRVRSSRRGRQEEPFWKTQLQKLPLGVVVGGAVAATGAIGALLLLFFGRRREYRVQKGDCLIQIAQKVGKKDWKQLYDQNPEIEDPNFIKTEALLRV